MSAGASRVRGGSLQGYSVTGIGLASSLGDAIQACAAARAGIVRTKPLPFAAGMDGLEPALVNGHSCWEVDGFGSFGRLSCLAAIALEDLFSRWSPKQVAPSRTVLLLNQPLAIERPSLDEHLGFLWEQGQEETEGEALLRCLKPLLPMFLLDAPVQFLQAGHAGGLLAIETAVEILQAGRADACIVCCVDSYLDLSTLEWLNATGRLKSVSQPVGFMPGEGAGAFVIESEVAARRRGAGSLATLDALGVGREPHGYFDEDFSPRGEALSAALLQAGCIRDSQVRDVGLILSDLNGQTRRAMDWGYALSRCVGVSGVFGGMRLWPLPVNFGDVGSATGAFLVCNAVRAFTRGYSLGKQVLLFACSEDGQRAAVALSAPR
ncbi:beta-ketoacyl synthase N-terminal-like domain-containing protein [Corallococcus terminator]|uniref:beta-ketoacyl synthase N-terminal-like domain-containing protein n=1 Tax=Corallococcus terminator TaxID=2316733 RepID=UPI0013157F03|nr:beta-ketoacyl synthase N-terminal-like domain-containing protein [Corallococcus terminator]